MTEGIEHGGCHCGAVRFTVVVRERIALDCNCSICTMKGFLHLIVPKEDFTLVRGGEALSEYRFGTGVARHTFCRTCGMHPFYTPRSHPDGVDVNVRCLDGDAITGVAALRDGIPTPANGAGVGLPSLRSAPLIDRFVVRAFDGRRWEENVGTIRGA